MRSCLRFLIIMIAVGPLAAQAQQGEEFAPPPLERFDELIGVLMTLEERTAWARLRSAGPRRAFIDRFWEIRDPTPGTEVNEVRDIFMWRARRATALYGEGAVAGYATDRGKVLIVYGLPDEQEYRALPRDTDSAQLAWTFSELEEPVRFTQQGDQFLLGVEVALDNRAFVKSAESELRLPLAAAMGSRRLPPVLVEVAEDATDDESSTSPAPEPTVDVAPEVRIWMRMVFAGTMRDQIELRHRVHFFPATEGAYTVLAFELDGEDLGYAVPPVKIVAKAAAEAAEEDDWALLPPTHGPHGNLMSALVRRCTKSRLVEEGLLPIAALPVAALPATALGLPELPLPGDRTVSPDIIAAGEAAKGAVAPIPTAALKLFGAVLQGEPGRENTLHQFIIPFCVPASGTRVAAGPPDQDPIEALQGLFRSVAVTLVPGTYRLAWGVYDEATGRATTRDEVIEVPDFAAPELAMSSVLVARPPHRDDPVAVRTDRVYPGIRLGNVLLSDDIERVVDRNETIEIVVIVTGWRSDPGAPGKPRLQVGYRILHGENERAARVQAQILDFHVLGQQIPLRQVDMLEPGGRYDVEIRVLDLIAGVEIRRVVPIRIDATVAEETTGPRQQ